MANEYKAWKGAVEPNDLGAASGNEVIMDKGAVQPTRSYVAVVVASIRSNIARRRRLRIKR